MYSIEYSHIYLNETLDDEKLSSIQIARNLMTELEAKNEQYVKVVMLDDYNPKEKTLDVSEFLNKLRNSDASPDYMVYESGLTDFSSFLLDEMQGKLRKSYRKYIINKRKIPCSLLIAVWHLSRLGVIKLNKKVLHKLSNKNIDFYSDKLITILPRRYRLVETKARHIIESTKYQNLFANMSNIYY